MKKFLLVCLSVAVCAITAQAAYAATTDTLSITVTVTPVLSVDITEDALALGNVAIGETKASASGVTVTNNSSGVNETYELAIANPSGWTAGTSAGTNQYVLNAAFDANGAEITWNPTNHALSTTSTASSATQFAGDRTGVGVAQGATRKLWFEFRAPTSTTVTSEQTITLTITAALTP